MKFNKLSILMLGIASASLVTGCSSTVTKEDIVKQEAEVQQARMDAQQEINERKQEQMEKQAEQLPDWVVSPPRADATGFYGVGLGIDEDLLTSMRKANLQAKYDVASTMRSELSGEDTMTGSSAGQYRYVINNFVNSVPLTGVEVVNRSVKPVDGTYKTYVLVKLPYDKFNLILKNQAKPEDTRTLQESYDRLMKRVEDKKSSESSVQASSDIHLGASNTKTTE